MRVIEWLASTIHKGTQELLGRAAHDIAGAPSDPPDDIKAFIDESELAQSALGARVDVFLTRRK